LPQTFTGTLTGAWMLFPDTRPEASSVVPTARLPPAAELLAAVLPVEELLVAELPAADADDWSPYEVLPQELPVAGLSAATAPTVLPHTFTGTSIGAWMLFPDSRPEASSVAPTAIESASAGVPDRDRMPVAAAAANTPLLRVCRNVLIFLLEELGKPALVRRSTSKAGPGLTGRLVRASLGNGSSRPSALRRYVFALRITGGNSCGKGPWTAD